MPAKSIRKVLRQGTSLTITIPIDYRVYHNLKPKDEVVLIYDNAILIIPKNREEEFLKDPIKRKLIEKLLK